MTPLAALLAAVLCWLPGVPNAQAATRLEGVRLEGLRVGEGWWNASWGNRRKITFNNAASAENLANFPVLVKLTGGTNIDYAKTQNSGQDLRFVDADGTTVLAYEIEKWDETGGTADSFVWVKVPQIDTASTTDYIWMYYNNTGASDCQTDTACPDAVNVWDANYKGVWHLPNGTTLTLTDSTTSPANLTNAGLTAAAGQVDGGANNEDGTNTRRLYASNPAKLQNLSAWTASAWVKITSMTNTDGDSEQIIRSNATATLVILTSTSTIRETIGTDGAYRSATSSTTISTGAWHLLTTTYAGGAVAPKLYLDGTEVSYSSTSGGAGTNASDAGNTVWGAAASNDSFGNVNGSVDDLRISNSARSADWVEAEYLFTVDSAKYTYAAEEAR